MNLPIVITDGYDITIHESVEHAVAHIEPADLKSKGIVAYDGEGYLLNLFIVKMERTTPFLWTKLIKRYEIVEIRMHTPRIDYSLELRDKLTGFLAYHGIPARDMKNLSLKELIQTVGTYMPW